MATSELYPFLRDNYSGESSADIHSYKDLVDFLNQLNKSWNEATKRLSPQVLIELMESTGKQFCEQIALLRPFGAAVFSKGISPEEAMPVVEILGDRQLGAVAMQMVSVMA